MGTAFRTICFILLVSGLSAQVPRDAVAVFNFDQKSTTDLVHGMVPVIHGCRFWPDRFDNEASALFFQGNAESFAKLGPNSIMDNEKGSVSLWINMIGTIATGKGVHSNPIFTTRSHNVDTCNDAIYIGVDMNTQKMNGSMLNSPLDGVSIYSNEAIKNARWYHVVLTYDFDYLSLYVNGSLEYKAPKKFKTQFLAGDSLWLGLRTGPANERYFLGCIDDIALFDRVLTGEEVVMLYNAPDPNRSRIATRWVLFIIGLCLLGVLVTWLIRKRVDFVLEKEKKKNLLRNRWLEQENKVLSAQMDPHFIFNSLNTIHHLIVVNENEKAQRYLSKFARLIRKILETNTRESINLREEIEIIEKYLEIESLRFNQVFSYNIVLDTAFDPGTIYIPHFMLQPIIENAIWHGLLPKEGHKEVSISFSLDNEDSLLCTIEDNGVGREDARKRRKTDKKSLALNFIEQRLQLFSKLGKGNYYLEIVDKAGDDGKALGTRVNIRLPLLKINEYEKSDHNR